MSTAITPESYAEKAARLTSNWQSGSGPLRLQKSTISNLFRYQPRGAAARRLSLGEFNHVLAIDKAARTVEVEGLTTYETVVRYCLEHGFLPLVAPELKHITVGGATVGIGIESTCFRYGFVHDGLIEADVLRRAARSSRRVPTTRSRPVRRAAEFLRHARLHLAREDRAASRKPLCARARRKFATPPSISGDAHW
jgi:hypothetical protein